MDALIRPRQVPTEVQGQIRHAIRELPVLGKAEVDEEEMCAICLTPFSSIFAEADEERGNQANQSSPPGGYAEDGEEGMVGVTKVSVCGHVFCRRDLAEWISGFHGNCPTCRQPFLEIVLPSESDDESSDGGEYVPTDYLEDEDDTIAMSDAFSEMEGGDLDLTLEEYLQRAAEDEESEEGSAVLDLAQGDDGLSNLGSEDASAASHAGVAAEEDWPVAEDDFPPRLHAEMDFSDIDSETEDGDDNPYLYALSEVADSDDDMDGDYNPMDEGASDTDSEPSFSLTDGESEDMTSEVDDLSLEELYSGAMFPVAEDRVSVHGMEDELDLPDHEKDLSNLDSTTRGSSKGHSEDGSL